MLNLKWWQNVNQNSWYYWNDPWSEIRVSKIHEEENYFFLHPSHKNKELLKKWENNYATCYRTNNKEIAKETLDLLGLPLPEATGKFSYLVYWYDLMYYI